MKFDNRFLAIVAGFALFLGLPLLIYALGDFTRRSFLKEALSVLTLLSFAIMIGQLFLARSNTGLLSLFKPPSVQRLHKYLAYGAVSVMALHPFLVVLPRYFEGGVRPLDAFWTMITTFDNLGIVLGLIAWALMLVIGATAFFRTRLFKRFKTRYRGWRSFHGGLAVGFIIVGAWHAITLGRHVDLAMTIFFLSLIAAGLALLARLYWPVTAKGTVPRANSQGAQS